MSDDALYGSYSDLKFYKSLGVARISIDVPLEQAGKIVALLGTPTQNDATWVGIARLKSKPEEAAAAKVETQERLLNGEEPAKPKRRFDEMSRPIQAGMLCGDAEFWEWLDNSFDHPPGISSAEDCASIVRQVCGVNSRAELNTNLPAGATWDRIASDFTDHRIATRQLAEQGR